MCFFKKIDIFINRNKIRKSMKEELKRTLTLKSQINETDEEISIADELLDYNKYLLRQYVKNYNSGEYQYKDFIFSLTKELMNKRIESSENRIRNLNRRKKELNEELEASKNKLSATDRIIYDDITKNSI